MTAEVYLEDFHLNVLVQLHYISGMGNAAVSQLRDMHEAVLVDTDVHESTEVGDVRDDAGQNHAGSKVLDVVDAAVEAELFKLLSWVTAGFLQLLHDVLEGRQTHGVGGVSVDVYARAHFLVADEVGHGALLVVCHLLDNGV